MDLITAPAFVRRELSLLQLSFILPRSSRMTTDPSPWIWIW